jgi:holliday junction DNA helicase RuvA
MDGEWEHMIASVSGTVQTRRPDHVVLECAGVGYRMSVSSKTLERVPAVGQSASLLAHLILRDDGINLYGFATEAERDLFLRLTSVSGIGPKMALTALSGSSTGELRKAIAAGDAKRFQVVPGIGRKTAERVIVELRETIAGELDGEAGVASVADDSPRALARDGLVGLGYDPAEAESMLESALGVAGDDAPAETLIETALREAVKAA